MKSTKKKKLVYNKKLLDKEIHSEGEVISDIEIAACVVSDVSLSTCTVEDVVIDDTVLSDMKFRDTHFEGLDVDGGITEIRSSKFNECSVNNSYICNMDFIWCNFTNNTIITNTTFVYVNFKDCLFSGVRFENCTFEGVEIEKCIFNGVYSHTYKNRALKNVFTNCTFKNLCSEIVNTNINARVTTCGAPLSSLSSHKESLAFNECEGLKKLHLSIDNCVTTGLEYGILDKLTVIIKEEEEAKLSNTGTSHTSTGKCAEEDLAQWNGYGGCYGGWEGDSYYSNYYDDEPKEHKYKAVLFSTLSYDG